jgi:hypothetical protein
MMILGMGGSQWSFVLQSWIKDRSYVPLTVLICSPTHCIGSDPCILVSANLYGCSDINRLKLLSLSVLLSGELAVPRNGSGLPASLNFKELECRRCSLNKSFCCADVTPFSIVLNLTCFVVIPYADTRHEM